MSHIIQRRVRTVKIRLRVPCRKTVELQNAFFLHDTFGFNDKNTRSSASKSLRDILILCQRLGRNRPVVKTVSKYATALLYNTMYSYYVNITYHTRNCIICTSTREKRCGKHNFRVSFLFFFYQYWQVRLDRYERKKCLTYRPNTPEGRSWFGPYKVRPRLYTFI